MSNNNDIKKNSVNINKKLKFPAHMEDIKFLYSHNKNYKNNCKRKISYLNENTTNNIPIKTYSNPNMKFCNNKYKINYTTKSYAEIKSKEMTNEKCIMQKVSNFRVNIKDIKNRFNELSNNNNNFKKINIISNNSRNIKRNNEIHKSNNNLLSTNNYTAEEFKQNLNEINDSAASKNIKEKFEIESSAKSPSSSSCINNQICNNLLITNNQLAGNINKYTNNGIPIHRPIKSYHFSHNSSYNFKLDLLNKNTTSKKLGNCNKISNKIISLSLKSAFTDQSGLSLNKKNEEKKEKR